MSEQEKNKRRWGVLITTLVAGFTVILNNSLLSVALPVFMTIYEISVVQAQWLLTVFGIGMLISMSIAAYMSKKFGSKKVFIISLIFFGCAAIFGALAWNFPMIIVARFFQGLAGGMIMPISLILIFSVFDKSERGFAMGIWGISAMAAPAIGPTIAGIILNYSSWQLLFLINIPTSLICLITALRFLKRKTTETEKNSFDWTGFALITIGLICVLLSMERFSQSPIIIVPVILLIIGVICVWRFVLHELKIEEPLLNVRILMNKVYSSSLAIISCSVLGMFTIILMIPILFQEVMGESPLLTGLALFPNALMIGISMTIGGKILDRKGPLIPFMIGIILISTMAFIMSRTIDIMPLWAIFVLLAVYGAGNGLINTPATTTAMNSLQDKNIRAGASILNMLKQVIKAVAVVFLSVFFEFRRGIYISQDYTISSAGMMAIKEAFLLLSCLLILTIPLIIYISRRYVTN